jgi:acyl-CoA thioesterase YciA
MQNEEPSLSEKPKSGTQELMLRIAPGPKDLNAYGDVFGGWIMEHVDAAGAYRAAQCAKARASTVAVNSFTFKEPVFIGDLVSFYARIVKVGRTSIQVEVEVYAHRLSTNLAEEVKVTEAIITYVAVDENRRPRPVNIEG